MSALPTRTRSVGHPPGQARLRDAIKSTPLIDHHAHPLLRQEALAKHPFETIISEARGDALAAAWSSLAHMRAVKQLASLLSCSPTWEAVVSASEGKRGGDRYTSWTRTCLLRLETILVDDGLGSPQDMCDYQSLDDYTNSPCLQIVRIESVFEDILANSDGPSSFQEAVSLFDTQLTRAIHNPQVVGFKSVICYRTGLHISASSEESAKEAYNAHHRNSLRSGEDGRPRVSNSHLTQFLVHRTASLIQQAEPHLRKPFQFHTGLGDNDLNLAQASPSHLQWFISQYPNVPIVLLHAGYPFSKEAAYLASTYANVWVDVSLVFPCVSRTGQEAVVHELLELAPWTKILFSTDGHFFPETYYLAQVQMREVLETVLSEYVRKGDLSWRQAEELVIGVLYQNSNQLYKLGLPRRQPQIRDSDISAPAADSSENVLLRVLESYVKKDSTVDYVRLYWNDMTGMTRVRAVDIGHITKSLRDTGTYSMGITKACLGLLQNDTLVPGVSATGDYHFRPDPSWVKPGPRPGHLSMYGEFVESDGSLSPFCPRAALKKAVAEGQSHGYEFLCGFELELILVERGDTELLRTRESDGHAWSSSRMIDRPIFIQIVEKALAYLRSVDVHIEQVHAESAPGQFEIVLPAKPPLEAVDTLFYVREVVSHHAALAGYRMTLHPKPFPAATGIGAHVHMSILPPGGDHPVVYEAFYAGVLAHLRAISAFTLSNPTSYDRVVDGCWAGGRWIAWGTQNRETPLRKIAGSHWEMKCLDGIANLYLALAAVLQAGVDGIRKKRPLVLKDCYLDPGSLTESERLVQFGITNRIPESLSEALEALSEDADLRRLIGSDLVSRYVSVKGAEVNLLDTMTEEEAKQWVMERY